MNSCDKRVTKKISFSCRNSKNKIRKHKLATNNNKISNYKKIINIKNSILQSNFQVRNNFDKYENFILKLKKAIDLLKNNKNIKIQNFEKSTFLKEKLIHFEEDNNFLKDQLLKKENNIKFFKNEFSKFHKLILNKKIHKEIFIDNFDVKKKNILIKNINEKKIVINNEQKKYFSKLVQTNFDLDNNKKKKNLKIKECFETVLQSNYKTNNDLNKKKFLKEKNYFFSFFEDRKNYQKKDKKNYRKNQNINQRQKNFKSQIEINENFKFLLNENKKINIKRKEIKKNYEFIYNQIIRNLISIKKEFNIENLFHLYKIDKISFQNSIKKNYNLTIRKNIKKIGREKNYIFLNKKIINKRSLKNNYSFSQILEIKKNVFKIKITNRFYYLKTLNFKNKNISKNLKLLINKKNHKNLIPIKIIEEKIQKIELNHFLFNIINIKSVKEKINKNFEQNYFISNKKCFNNFNINNSGTILLNEKKKLLLKSENIYLFSRITKNTKNSLKTKEFFIFNNLLFNKNNYSDFDYNLFKNIKRNKIKLKISNFSFFLRKSKNQFSFNFEIFNIFTNFKSNNQFSLKDHNYFLKQKLIKKKNLEIQILTILEQKRVLNPETDNISKDTNLKNTNQFTISSKYTDSKNTNQLDKSKITKEFNNIDKITERKEIKEFENISKKYESKEKEIDNKINNSNSKENKKFDNLVKKSKNNQEFDNISQNSELKDKMIKNIELMDNLSKNKEKKDKKELDITKKNIEKENNQFDNKSKNSEKKNNKELDIISKMNSSKNTNYFDNISKSVKSKKIENSYQIDFVKKYTKTKNKLCQLTCVYRLNDKKLNNKIFELTTKLNNKKDNPGKLQMMKELIKKMEIEMDFLTRKLDKILSKMDVNEYNDELENKNKKLFLVIKNLQEKLKKSNKKVMKIMKKKKYCEENLCFTNKFLEYILMNFFRFDYKKIENLYCYDSFSHYKENLKDVMNLLEKCFLDLNKEKSKFKNLNSENIRDNLKVNFVIIDYLKKNLKMKNKMKDLNEEKSNFEEVMETVANFGFEKEQIKSSFVKFFYFIKIKKFKELQMVSKVILDLLDLDNDEKNKILEILLNLL